MNNYILQILEDIMAIDSPSGYTKNVITYCEKYKWKRYSYFAPFCIMPFVQ